MQIISWNMGCAPRRTRYRRTHGEAWDYLAGELQPDVALIQEALLATPVPAGYRLIWSKETSSDSGTALMVRKALGAKGFEATCEGSYLAGATLDVGGKRTTFMSIHVGPPNYRKHLRVLAEYLKDRTAGRAFVVGGDLNAAREIDTVYGGRWFTRYFDDLISSGFHDCHWAKHKRERQSFWGHQARHEYQCDHAFVDAGSKSLVGACEIIDNAKVRALSDHGPLRLVINPERA